MHRYSNGKPWSARTILPAQEKIVLNIWMSRTQNEEVDKVGLGAAYVDSLFR